MTGEYEYDGNTSCYTMYSIDAEYRAVHIYHSIKTHFGYIAFPIPSTGLPIARRIANPQRSRVGHQELDLQGEAQGDTRPFAGGGTFGDDALAGRRRKADVEHRKRELHGRARVHASSARVPQWTQIRGPHADTLFGRDPVDR